MITYDMTARGGLSKYEYLFQRIRADIRTGAIQPGSRLPSKRALAKHLSISVNTVENAYDLLVGSGYVSSKPGSGYTVLNGKEDAGRAFSYGGEGAEAAPGAEGANVFGSPGIFGANAGADVAGALSPFDMHANSCSRELFPADAWARIMRRVLSGKGPELFDTVPFNGLPELRRAIARHLYEFKGMRVDPACVVVGAGTEYLYTKVLQLLGPDAVIGIGDPGFKKLVQISAGTGVLWVHLPVDGEGMEVSALRNGRVNVVHVSPANHFPVGAVMSSGRRRELLDWVHADADRYIIEDDYDSELRFEGRVLPRLYTQDDRGRVIYMNTFSKTLVPSLRISYMVLPEALMEMYRARLSFYSCTVSAFEQSALADFIARGYFEKHINRQRQFYDKQRERFMDAIENSQLTLIGSVRPVHVGTHMLLDVDTGMTDGEVKAAARARGMRLSMLSDYYAFPTALSAHTVVLNFASIVPDQIEDAVHLLEEVFERDIAFARAIVI